MSEEKKTVTRTSEQAVAEITALTNLLNTKVAHPKFTKEKILGKIEERATGSVEVSPFSDSELYYIKSCLISLVNQFIDKGELTYKKDEVKEAKQDSENTEDIIEKGDE